MFLEEGKKKQLIF